MRLSISIVEDSISDSNHLQQIINSWSNASDHSVELFIYQSAEQLLNDNHWKSCELIFLDIDLPHTNGIELANQLRSQASDFYIVFLTSFREYVFDGYSVSALDYIIKPANSAKIIQILNKTFNDFLGAHYIQRISDGYLQIPFSKIYYFSSQGHNINIITTNHCYSYLSKTSSFHNLIDRLPGNFLRCHRTIIVNIDHILQLTGYEITLSNQEKIPVSRSYIQSIRSAFMDRFTF